MRKEETRTTEPSFDPSVLESRRARKSFDPSVLESAHVPSRVAKDHSTAFASLEAELASLAQKIAKLPTVEQNRSTDALKRCYTALGKQMTLASNDEVKKDLLQRALTALDQLISSGIGDRLTPAICTATGLIENAVVLAAQKKVDINEEQLRSIGPDAIRNAQLLMSELEGREHIGSALNVFPNLVGLTARGVGKPLSYRQLLELCRTTIRFLQDTAPKAGLTRGQVAKIVALYAEALTKHPGKPVAAMREAHDAFVKLFDQTRETAQEKIKAPPQARGYFDTHLPMATIRDEPTQKTHQEFGWHNWGGHAGGIGVVGAPVGAKLIGGEGNDFVGHRFEDHDHDGMHDFLWKVDEVWNEPAGEKENENAGVHRAFNDVVKRLHEKLEMEERNPNAGSRYEPYFGYNLPEERRQRFLDPVKGFFQSKQKRSELKKGSVVRAGYDAISSALDALLEKNPAATHDLATAALHLRNAAVMSLSEAPEDKEKLEAYLGIARIIERITDSPAATPVLKLLTSKLQLNNLHDLPEAIDIVRDAARQDLPRALVSLAFCGTERSLEKYEGLAEALDQLGELNDTAALRTATIIAERLDAAGTKHAGAMASAVIDLLETTSANDVYASASKFASSYCQAATALDVSLPEHPEAGAIADSIARESLTRSQPYQWENKIATLLQTVHNALPATTLQPLLCGEPNLYALIEFGRHDPTKYFQQLTETIKPHVGRKNKLPQDHIRRAIDLACAVCEIELHADRRFERLHKDWKAVLGGKSLACANSEKGMLAVRAAQAPSFETFVAEHPTIPIELAPTAALHLSPKQLSWLTEQIGDGRSKDRARRARDFIFACVDNKKTELIELVASGSIESKTVSDTLAYFANAWQNGEKLPFGQVMKGLKAGQNPVEEIVAAQQREQLESLDLGAIIGPDATDEGLRILSGVTQNIAGCLEHFNADYKGMSDSDVPYAELRGPFLEVVRNVANGSYPASRYANEVGKHLLRHLSSEQQALWKRELVTPLDETSERDADMIRDAVHLLNGLAQVLPAPDLLGVEEMPAIDWDQSSLTELRSLRDQKLADLRAATKGTNDHRKTSVEIGPVNDNLALLEFYCALKDTLEADEADPRAILRVLKPLIAPATRAAKHLELPGVAQALDLVGRVRISTDPKAGCYAVDEDGFEPLINSNHSGCLNPLNGFRRWGLSQALADANTKMLRVYNEKNQMVYRGFLRVFQVELDNGYKGPALWAENAVGDGGGGARERELWVRHAIKKAAAMGIPLLSGNGLEEAAIKLGLEKASAKGTIFIEEGHTKVMHSDKLFWGKGMIDELRGENEIYAHESTYSFVMPPEAKK